ncbi:uncharacterized protein LOC133815381 [Humulus lupulus]|uniref:uncharacterized protein LOC133815381 n=1 Tax=Humulus lupulus TaxID=3486 RepID=UPI002B41081F|nr:uncharacterized protein LOC133815381 [Humulus lupulus]
MLLGSLEEFFQATQAEVPYRKPNLIRKDISKRDTNKFYCFHYDYGHRINGCNQLKDEIKFLICQNPQAMRMYSWRHSKKNQVDAPNMDALAQPLQPAPVAGRLDMICGGPHLAGESRKALESYAQTIFHEPGDEVLVIEERTPKTPRYECKSITFTENDAMHVKFLHNDPLVIEAQIANMIVVRTMIDHGSSVNILFKTTIERMKLYVRDLEPCTQTLYDFTEKGMAPARTIKLVVTVGIAPTNSTVMAIFVAVDTPSTFYALLRRPILIKLRAITSTFHLMMKFLTNFRIGCAMGDQREARECYVTPPSQLLKIAWK